nr:dnaJ homolog subfamily B member 13-like isoform X2 [Halyomorpha halys]
MGQRWPVNLSYTANPRKFFGTANPYADLMYCMKDQIAVFKASKVEDVRVKEQSYERELELTLEEVYRGTMKKLKIERQAFDDDYVTTHLKEKVICIKIKPGMPSGSRIVFQNVGDEGPCISPGDLVIITKDLPHPKFKRDGVNLHMEVTLDLYQSLEKLIVELNTLDDRVIRFAITDVISAGFLKVVHGEGMPYVEDPNKKGDLIIKFEVSMPSYIEDSKRKKLIQALLTDEDQAETPEGLYRLWLAAKLKRNVRPLSKKGKRPVKSAVEDVQDQGEEQGQEDDLVASAIGGTAELCKDVPINKDSLYKL